MFGGKVENWVCLVVSLGVFGGSYLYEGSSHLA